MEQLSCVVCQSGNTRETLVTETVQRGKTVLVIRGIPARACRTCGEKYLSEATTDQLMKMLETAVKTGVETAFRVFPEPEAALESGV